MSFNMNDNQMCNDCGFRIAECDRCACCRACCDCSQDREALQWITKALDALDDIFARRDEKPPIERKVSRRFRGKMDE